VVGGPNVVREPSWAMGIQTAGQTSWPAAGGFCGVSGGLDGCDGEFGSQPAPEIGHLRREQMALDRSYACDLPKLGGAEGI